MKTSHILNAINHHTNQIHTVASILGNHPHLEQAKLDNLEARQSMLVETVDLLGMELASRNPDEDDDKEKKEKGNYHDRY